MVWSVALLGDKMLLVSQREVSASQSPTCLSDNPTGVFGAGTLNSHARSRGSPDVTGSQNVIVAMQPVLNSP